MSHLQANGIPVALHYPAAVHQQPAYGVGGIRLPRTEEVMRRILTLPLHPYLSEQAVESVCDQIRAFA
jgi:dTDP-4-amino-4,6-dideoxygalactose transaminase